MILAFTLFYCVNVLLLAQHATETSEHNLFLFLEAASTFQQDEQQQVESALNSFDKDSVLVCFPTGFEQLFHCERYSIISD